MKIIEATIENEDIFKITIDGKAFDKMLRTGLSWNGLIKYSNTIHGDIIVFENRNKLPFEIIGPFFNVSLNKARVILASGNILEHVVKIRATEEAEK